MTLENDPAANSGNASEVTVPASKPRRATKKSAPSKPAAGKNVTETASPAGEKEKTAPKPRASAKAAAAKSSPPVEAAPGKESAAKEKTTRTRGTAMPKADPAKAPAKPADTAETLGAKAPKTKTPAVKNTTARMKTVNPEKKAGAVIKTAAPEPEKPAVDSGANVPVETKQIRKPRSSRVKTPSKQAAQLTETVTPATPESRTTEPARQAPPPSVDAAQPTAVRPADTRSLPAENQHAPQVEAKAGAGDGDVAQAPAKSASRRSRRGGRRRNKARASAAAAAEANALPVKEESVVAFPGAAEEAHDAPEAPSTRDASAKSGQKEKSPAQKSGKNDAGKESAKQGSRKSSNQSFQAISSQETEADEPETVLGGKRAMFISVLSGELVEVVLAEEGQVAEYYVEMQHQAKVKGNIYKGVVSNIDANLQAAFISYAGGVKNGFLQIDELHPEYYLGHHDPAKGRKFPPIQRVLKPGQEILVQVVKEPAGTKGAFLTSYLSLPGRFLVLTPGREQIGVSRKVDSDDERVRLRAMLEGLKPGPGLGVIVRTVSSGASKTSMQRDLQFLKRLWKDVRSKGQAASAPSLIYEELDLSTRAVRDYLTEEVQEILVDDDATAAQVAELVTLLFPKKKSMVQVYHDSGQSLFERFSLQKQLDQIHSREVSLPSGGSLVIDKTEALTAIDINSGRSSGKSNFEDMAYRTNMEAARAIPLQLRLRDIGGQIVADFIEMRNRDHWREVEKTVRSGMKGDRARYDVGKIGPFGMLEIVRQRLGSSAISISTEPCPCCKGTGIRRNMEWRAMQSLREIGRKLRQTGANNQTSLIYNAEPELAFYLLNTKRAMLQNLECESGISLMITPKTE